MAYISLNRLQREQNRLQLNLVKYSLEEEWLSSELIAHLRERLYPRMPAGLFDPQDLEHQVLFRLTTYAPDEITNELIEATIDEQLAIIEDRLSDVTDRQYLFRGLDRRNKDLNIEERLELKREGDRLYATGYGRTFEVEFKKITDESMIKLFTEKLHYIHNGRHKGDAFGFYFAGDDIPWGIETVEPALNVKKYKHDALLAHGIDPHKAVEITRLYLLPGSPKNSISILDGLVAKYYKDRGMEAMYTTTMPMYAKTRGATTAGGMSNVLLVKEQSHTFRKIDINGRSLFVHDTATTSNKNTIQTHPQFPTLLTVETYMTLNKSVDLRPLEILKDKVVYINPAQRRGEKRAEMRFLIDDLSSLFEKFQTLNVRFIETTYINDSFWGLPGSANKLRLRKIVKGDNIYYESSKKYRISNENHIRTLVNDILYSGESYDNAVSAIKLENVKFKRENSYEKIRSIYRLEEVTLSIDIYPFGAYLKLIGEDTQVLRTAETFGFDKKADIDLHADDIYLAWNKKMKLKELWNIRFGLMEAKKEKEII